MKKLLLIPALFSSMMYAQFDKSDPEGYERSGVSKVVEEENYAAPKQHEKFRFDSNESNQPGVYRYKYNPLEKTVANDKNNPFLSLKYEHIYRFDALIFGESNSFDDASEETFKKIIDTIKKIESEEKTEYVVSILGNTPHVDNKKENVVLDSSYTNFFQSIAQRDDIKADTAKEDAANYAKYVYEKMLDENISKDFLYQENRMGDDALYTQGTADGRELNSRVDVAIYAKKFDDPDTDGDGVHDSKDYCPKTPRGASVDENGCPQLLTMHLQFSFDGDLIEDEKSFNDIMDLAKFMNKYPVYRAVIIGHTDSVGKPAYNKKLSERRAALVVSQLTANGVSKDRLSSTGRGESEPVADNKTKEGRFENRRTEVELILPRKVKRNHIRLRKRGE